MVVSLYRILFFVLWGCLAAHAESLEDLDRIVSRHASLDAFLADGAAVEEYFTALQAYYGTEKLPRHSFDAVLAQLRGVVKEIPELKARLWETTGLGTPIVVAAESGGRGRGIVPEAWEGYLDGWRARLTAEARDIYARPPGERAATAQAALDAAAAQLAAGRAAIAETTGRAAKARREASLYSRVKADPGLRAALAYVLREKLTEERAGELLHARDADVVLRLLENMRAEPRRHEWSLRVPDDFLSLLASGVPSVKELLTREDIFPVKMRETRRGHRVPEGTARGGEYRGVPLPRRFHGIWKGVPLGECVGGTDDPGHAGKLNPERWLTVALRDTALWHVEREGRYLGFVQAVPVALDGRIYGSLDFGAPVLRQEFRETDLETGRSHAVSLCDRWIERLLVAKPVEWSGLVVGESEAISNAGVLPALRSSTQYALGRPVGSAATMTHPDPLAARIIAYARSLGKPNGYRGSRMIFDAGVSDAGTLRALAPTQALRDELSGLGHAEFLARPLASLPWRLVREVLARRARRVADADEALDLARGLALGTGCPWSLEEGRRELAEEILAPWLRDANREWLARAKEAFARDRGMRQYLYVEGELPRLTEAEQTEMARHPATLSASAAAKLVELAMSRAVCLEPIADLLRNLREVLPIVGLKEPPAHRLAEWLQREPAAEAIRTLEQVYRESASVTARLRAHLGARERTAHGGYRAASRCLDHYFRLRGAP